MVFGYSTALIVAAALALQATASVAQVHTDREGWRTSRSEAQCATYRNVSNLYQTRVFFLTGVQGEKFVIIRLDASKYPGWVKGPAEREMSVLISNARGVAHRLKVRLSREIEGRHLNVIFTEDILPYLRSGTRIQINYPGDITQNVALDFGNLEVALEAYDQCERIRLGQAASGTQMTDRALDDLEPFEKAKHVCAQELEHTGGLAPADNPYYLNGRRYANACDAAEDYAYRKATRFQSAD